MDYARVFGVKQFVAVVQNRRGSRFMVFTCNDSRYYVFSQLDPDGCATGLLWPVLRSRLRDDLRRSLAHGFGNASL